ncbi:MAG: hypothetical protein PHF47_03450 [Bacilli bacterium]|nr:hypothetical protein [Bacilli bacterium]
MTNYGERSDATEKDINFSKGKIILYSVALGTCVLAGSIVGYMAINSPTGNTYDVVGGICMSALFYYGAFANIGKINALIKTK